MRIKNRMIKLILAAVFMVYLLLPAFSTPANSAAGDRDAGEIVKKASPSVVRVEVRDRLKRVATGVVIDKDGYIATTALISPKNEKVSVVDQTGARYEADFLGFDPQTRIAFLQVKEKRLTAVNLGSATNLYPGAWVCALGISPDGGVSVTQGIVSSTSEDRLRLNIWITPGMSGGPVLDEKGQLVGLLRGVYSEESPVLFRFRDRETTGTGYVFSRAEAPAAGMAMAIPVELLNRIFKEIRTKGKVERGWLGVSIAEDREGQVVITYVEEKSPAELVKLQEGDRMVKIDGKEVRSSDQLVSEIRNRQPGQEIALTIERNGKTQEVKAKLGAMPEEEAFKELELRFPDLFREMPRMPAFPAMPKFPEGERFEFGVENYRFIGVYLEQLNPELSGFFGVQDGRGLLVSRITPASPAEKAALKVGDVIIGADGKRVETLEALTDLIQNKKKGEKISLDVIRNKKKMKIEVEVAEEERRAWPRIERFSGQMKHAEEEYQKAMKKWQEELQQESQVKMEKLKEELNRIRPMIEDYKKKLTEKYLDKELEILAVDSFRRI
jgi:S1-C subfamily serine protease